MISSSSTSNALKMKDTAEKATRNKNLIDAIATTNNPDFVKIRKLLVDGADVNCVTGGFTKNNLKWTPLACASYYGHEAVAKMLLKFGAHVDGENGTESPLYCASMNGHVEVIDILMPYKPNVNITNFAEETPLLVASINGYNNVIERLLRHGAKIDQANLCQETPLYCASRRGFPWVVDILLRNGANIDKANNNGETPLEVAILNGHKRIVKMLKSCECEILEDHPPMRAGERNRARVIKTVSSESSSEIDMKSHGDSSPKDVKSFVDKTTKKKKKKKSYKNMMADLMSGDGSSSKPNIKRDREELRKVTGGGAFTKVDKI